MRPTGNCLRSPGKVPHHLIVLVECIAVRAIVAVVGPDSCKPVLGRVREVLILDACSP